MTSGIMAFSAAAFAVTLAEMGDKTQLLAMCFASRFKPLKVMIGVFIATVFNHALAVAAGYFLSEILSKYTDIIQIVASISFIGFALWTIKGDSIDDSCETKKSFGPVITVTIAFFLAEMGDKTQFVTASLAAKFSGQAIFVLIGTTTGMLIADGIGIIFGVVMNRKIPENILKWISASIFALCGLAGYIQSAWNLMKTSILFISTASIILMTIIIACLILKNNKREEIQK